MLCFVHSYPLFVTIHHHTMFLHDLIINLLWHTEHMAVSLKFAHDNTSEVDTVNVLNILQENKTYFQIHTKVSQKLTFRISAWRK